MLLDLRHNPLLFALLLASAQAKAAWNIQSGEKYYITCAYTSGYVCPGSAEGSAYDVVYQTKYTAPPSSAYWYISKSGDAYTFENCESGEYLTWTSEYNQTNCKYLTLSSDGTADEALWTLSDGGGFQSIRSVAQPAYQFNLRKETLMMGCYESQTTDDNEQFHIYASDGTEVQYSAVTVRVTSISIEAETTSLEAGQELLLEASVAPDDATDPSVVWSSSNEYVATVSKTGLLTALAEGTTTVTATANDGGGVSASIEITVSKSSYLEHDDDMLYLRRSDSTVVVLPRSYVTEGTYSGSLFRATLADGEDYELKGVVDVETETPEDIPSLNSFKFNNKYNSQVFTDAECEDVSGDTLRLKVAGIGKWLTASFQLGGEGTKALVQGVRQRSKKTRQSFAEPVTYELTNPYWQELRIKRNSDGTFERELADFSKKVTVCVDFLTDHPTSSYGVPRIDITLSNTASWSSSNWIGKNGKSYYEEASIAIDGAGVFPDMESTPILIKGRGNSSWSNSYKSKNPYHFKFSEKQKPLGMKSGKHWILLSNKQTGSMTTNALGHKVGNLLETAATNHIVPVELYINGSYRGSYNLTERIGFSNNSIDIDDEGSAAIIEMDDYTDETIYKSNAYSLPAKIHAPDVGEEGVSLTANTIISDYNKMMSVVKGGSDSYTKLVDPDYLARYLLACEIIWNGELKHPKSVYLYSENVTDAVDAEGYDPTPWVFGPLWDCDWAFGYEVSYTYFVNDAEVDLFSYILSSGDSKGVAGQFFNALRYNSTEVDEAYYRLMYDFVNGGGLDELEDYCDEYYAFASSSFAHNTSNETSDRDGANYSTTASNSKTWFQKRASYVLSRLNAYDISEDEGDEDESPADRMGDVNDDGLLGVADLVCVLNYLEGIDNDTFLKGRADVDSNGEISSDDVGLLRDTIMAEAADASRNRHLPSADITWQLPSRRLDPQSLALLPLILTVDEGSYSALQFDLQLPSGIELDAVELPASMQDFEARLSLLGEGKWRVLLYADGNHPLPSVTDSLELRLATGETLEGYAVISGATASTSDGQEERLACLGALLTVADEDNVDDEEEGEGETDALRNVSGDGLNSEGTVYDLSGRPVRQPKTHGVYIIGGRKVLLR
ncbi:MAG: Ig-like domain-containing protein [Prevotellaceae bacterium]|nr:Ig-like domain-containing protein [Prevotellaceae bacterium]